MNTQSREVRARFNARERCWKCRQKVVPTRCVGGWRFDCSCGAVWLSLPALAKELSRLLREE
jgi:hypothetical protein